MPYELPDPRESGWQRCSTCEVEAHDCTLFIALGSSVCCRAVKRKRTNATARRVSSEHRPGCSMMIIMSTILQTWQQAIDVSRCGDQGANCMTAAAGTAEVCGMANRERDGDNVLHLTAAGRRNPHFESSQRGERDDGLSDIGRPVARGPWPSAVDAGSWLSQQHAGEQDSDTSDLVANDDHQAIQQGGSLRREAGGAGCRT